ncbi:tyrosine-type recombinase/integrase [Salinicoccus sp. CNSTN-B1]
MLLKFAIQDFIDDRRYNNSSAANIRNIHYNLNAFYDYCVENDIVNLEEIKHEHVKDYLNRRRKLGDKPNTLNTRLLRIRSLFNYCVESEYIRKSPASKVKRIIDDDKVTVFTDEQIEQMLAYYRRLKQRDKRLYASRDYMLIVFLLGTGFRRTETCNLKWSDVDLEKKSIKVFGKNRTLQHVVISDVLAKELASYYLFLKRYFDKEVEYVFPNRYGEQLTTNAIHLIFKALSKKMNFKDVRVSCHTFRHTYCNRLVTAGANPFVVMRFMRHKNITVTNRYVNIWSEELREMNNEYNPLNRLNI